MLSGKLENANLYYSRFAAIKFEKSKYKAMLFQ